MKRLLVLASLAAPSIAFAQPAPPAPAPRYLEAMRAELEALHLTHECEPESETIGRCTFRHRGGTSGEEFTVNLVYSDDSDTIYLYIERYFLASPDAASTNAVLRHLMELNWQLLVGKFEWDPRDGEVRLSMTINTDSNFDRRTFRSIVRAIGPLADRYLGEIRRLAPDEAE
jgi:hypothetical protein